MKKLLFIYNPYSGKSQIRGHLTDILNQFIAAGYTVMIHPTQGPADATRVVQLRGALVDRIVCSGGDGTLNEVISGIMAIPREQRPSLGYIPAGTTNDFARSMKIPFQMEDAAKIAVTGEPFLIDVGRVNDSYFSYVFGFGAFTDISYATPQERKKALGHPAYVLEAIRNLSELKSYRVKVSWADQVVEDKFLLGMVSNSYSVAGMKGLWGEDIRLDEGEFEVTLIKEPLNIKAWAEMPTALISNKNGINENVLRFKASRIRFEAQEDINWVKDGEFGGTLKQAVIQNLQQAITIIKKGE